jgi:hypothetical protein
MTDKELLELAAKAAGYDVRWHEIWGCFVHNVPYNVNNPPTIAGQRNVWIPLHDDGDALRLAVKLRLTIQHNYSGVYCYDNPDFCDKSQSMIEVYENDIDTYAATRKAIVRAAADIGKNVP